MTKETRQIPTIGQASMSAGVSKEAFQKRIKYAIKSAKLSDIRQKLGIESDTPTGLRDAFTPELSALLSASGFDIPTVFENQEQYLIEKVEEEARINAESDWKEVDANSEKEPDTRLPSYPNPPKPPTKKTDTPEIKPDAIPPTKPDTHEIRQPKPDTTISDRFFQSEIIVLSALLILIFSDGFSMSLLAGRTFGGSGLAYVLFSVVGLIIGYSAISTTRAAYHARAHKWDTDMASFWIVLFAVFQTALHGSAFDLFGDWSDLVGRVLIVLSIPLATASLTTTILKR